jgi:hypothetical protein
MIAHKDKFRSSAASHCAKDGSGEMQLFYSSRSIHLLDAVLPLQDKRKIGLEPCEPVESHAGR